MFNVGQLTGEKVEVPKSMTRQALYERRKRAQFNALPSPWAWLTSAQASKLVLQAYRVASWNVWQQMQEDALTATDTEPYRRQFLSHLIDFFEDAAESAFALERGSATSDPSQAERRIAAWQSFSEEVPRAWKPQYPLYLDEVRKKVTPASAANASGVVINADEGNVNEHDSKG